MVRKAFVLLALVALGCGGGSVAPVQPPAPQTEPKEEHKPKPAILSREEFRKAAMGKTEAELLASLGRPTDTSDHGTEKTWFYRYRTLDPVTGATDPVAQVTIKNGKVTAVSF